MENSFSNSNRNVYTRDFINSEPQTNFNSKRLYHHDRSTPPNLNLHYDIPQTNLADQFPTILLTKSELENEKIQFNENKDPEVSSCEQLGNLDTMPNVTFFRGLKQYFTNSLLVKLKKIVNHIYKNDAAHYSVENDYIVLTANEFRDRALFILKFISSSETNIVHLFLELRNFYKVIENSSLPSVGSVLHSNGYCKPCVFANKKTNYCKTGFGCNFCHYNHKLTKSKGPSKSYAKLSNDNDFFKKLIRSPRSPESSTLISTTPEDSFSLVSSMGSLTISDYKFRNEFNSKILKYSHSGPLSHENGTSNGFLETHTII
uniref:C3H1-type domain-containing protein n=1 Tax=Theileria annulata TaxID=5874 RepID=A0A3B0NKK7_THEAN